MCYTVYDCCIMLTSRFFIRTTDSTCPFSVFSSLSLQNVDEVKWAVRQCTLLLVLNVITTKHGSDKTT